MNIHSCHAETLIFVVVGCFPHFPVLHNEGHMTLVTFRWFVLCVHRMTTFVFVLWQELEIMLRFFIIILRKVDHFHHDSYLSWVWRRMSTCSQLCWSVPHKCRPVWLRHTLRFQSLIELSTEEHLCCLCEVSALVSVHWEPWGNWP